MQTKSVVSGQIAYNVGNLTRRLVLSQALPVPGRRSASGRKSETQSPQTALEWKQILMGNETLVLGPRLGRSESVPVRDGHLLLGTWQGTRLLEWTGRGTARSLLRRIMLVQQHRSRIMVLSRDEP